MYKEANMRIGWWVGWGMGNDSTKANKRDTRFCNYSVFAAESEHCGARLAFVLPTSCEKSGRNQYEFDL